MYINNGRIYSLWYVRRHKTSQSKTKIVIGNSYMFINYNFVYCSHLEKAKTNMIGHILDFKCFLFTQVE